MSVDPHEIITVGLGNFATLACAQWANSATRFDAERGVIFRERAKGEYVPRLLLLDAGYPSVIADERVFDGGQGPGALRDGEFSEQEVRHAIFKHVRDGNSDDEEGDEGEGNAADDDASGAAAAASHRDPNAEADSAADNDGIDENMPLFTEKGLLVPWHLYIKTKLDPRTYQHLHNTHNAPRGLSQLHCFGHGAASMRPSQHRESEELADNLRRMLEGCDACQGVQFFIDADGAFGGAAQQQMAEFRDSFGGAIPLIALPLLNPPKFDPEDEFYRQHMQETILNEALTFATLTEASDLFVPFNMPTWSSWSRDGDARCVPYSAIGNDVAAAQVVVTAYDTATYAARQEKFDDFIPLRQFASLLRPQKGLSVCSALLSLPTAIPSLTSSDGRAKPTHLWSALEASPLMSAKHFRPLSFATPTFKFMDPELAAAGHVYPYPDARSLILSHAFALRGLGGLVDEVYPRDEALMRYALPMRTSAFRASVFNEGFPISDTFPVDALFPSPQGTTERTDPPKSVPVTSHMACTFAAGPHIARLAANAHTIFKMCRHVHRESYQMEDDEWREALEALDSLHNEYDREIPDDDGADGDM